MKYSFLVALSILLIISGMMGYSYYWSESHTTDEKIEYYFDHENIQYVPFSSSLDQMIPIANVDTEDETDYLEISILDFLTAIAELEGNPDSKFPTELISDVTIYFIANELNIYGRADLLFVQVEYQETSELTVDDGKLYFNKVFPGFLKNSFEAENQITYVIPNQAYPDMKNDIKTMVNSPFYLYFDWMFGFLKGLLNIVK